MSEPSEAEDFSLESTKPSKIGSGSFASVYSSPGRAIAIKVVHVEEHAVQIKSEFNALRSVYTLCNDDSIFAVPRALAFYDPKTQEILFPPPIDAGGGGRAHELRSRPFKPSFFANLPARACYVMDRASPLPTDIGKVIQSKFYSEKANLSGVASPLICRLYFGKELRPSAFVNPNNFPIDAARYDILQHEYPEALMPKERVAEGMGEMLSRIHWKAGYDGRDIEFVMTGSPIDATVRLYVIDFNQMRAFDKSQGDLAELVDAFFVNDPYYPRPVPNDALYNEFKNAYLDSCPMELRPRAARFLEAIGAFYATRQGRKEQSI